MTGRLALATATAARGLDHDEPLLVAALRQRAVEVTMAVWDDPSVDWAGFDAVVIRSTWDYMDRLPEFLAWLDAVAAVTVLHNPAAMVAWSLDKHYLAELGDGGVPIVPTAFVEPGGPFTPPPAGEYVVKPAVGAGTRHAIRCRAGFDDAVAATHIAGLLATGRSMLVQPHLGSVDERGETGVVYVGGRFSHAVNKRVRLPRAGAAVEGLYAEETTVAEEATTAMRAVADATMAAVPARLGTPLYARVDLLLDADGRPLVLELELAEPSLFLAEKPGSVDGFADAIAATVRT